jgi:F-type H+-transporting ATPase subunit gamma
VANLKEVRIRISSTTSTQQITKAMKLVSATKLRKAQTEIIQMRPYASKLKGVLESLGGNVSSDGLQAYMNVREVKNVILVVITSDRGLCGGFNANVIKQTNNLLQTKYKAQADAGTVELVCVGKKGYDFFSKSRYKVNGEAWNLLQRFNSVNAFEIAGKIIGKFVAKEADEIVMVYNQFKNAATQILTTEQLLPIDVKEYTGHNTPAAKKADVKRDYIFEPDKESILATLVPMTLKTQFYKACMDSLASEHGARMVAMDKATDNAQELLKALRLQYNQARQAAITREISEIVGGAAAL